MTNWLVVWKNRTFLACLYKTVHQFEIPNINRVLRCILYLISGTLTSPDITKNW